MSRPNKPTKLPIPRKRSLSEFKKSLIMSFMFHVLPLVALALLHGGPGGGKEKGGGNPMTGEKNFGSFQKPQAEQEVTVDLVTLPKQDGKDKDGIEKKRKEREAKEASSKGICGDNASYGGIGVTFSLGGKVVEAPEWYPAYKAGLRVGDEIIGSNEEIRGTPGTQVTVIAKHPDGGVDTYIITRGKICYQEIGNHNEP